MTLGNKINVSFLVIVLIFVVDGFESRRKGLLCYSFEGGIETEKICDPDEICVASYNDFGGNLAILFAGCYTDGDFCHFNHKDKCYLDKNSPASNAYFCCCLESMCNIRSNIFYNETVIKLLRPTTGPPSKTKKETTTVSYVSTAGNTTLYRTTRGSRKKEISILAYTIPIAFGVFVIIILTVWFVKKRKQNRHKERRQLLLTEHLRMQPDVIFQDIIHYGKFGNVRKGLYNGQLVAIKCLNQYGSQSWECENKIHSIYKIRHDNIVKFISTEKHRRDASLEYWTVTEYYTEGSLLDYLRSKTLNMEKFLNASLSIVKGLLFLHSQNKKVQPVKPAIVHCDLKTTNIFVKDGSVTCCIGDFGLATVLHTTEEPPRLQVGTPRYMSPELLEGVISTQEISIISLDVYALSLVLWELLSRCDEQNVQPENYEPPYHEFVGSSPDVAEMRVCVVDNEHRPKIKQEWKENPLLSEYCKSIEESWDQDCEARPTSACIHERLIILSNQYKKLNSDNNIASSTSVNNIQNNTTTSSSSGTLSKNSTNNSRSVPRINTHSSNDTEHEHLLSSSHEMTV